jgi:hypothetical protein
MFDFHAFNRARIAHGVLMSLAIIVFFPMGGFLVRLLSSPRTVRIHMLCQIIGLGILVAGFGLGLRIQEQIHIVSRISHLTLETCTLCEGVPRLSQRRPLTYYTGMD